MEVNFTSEQEVRLSQIATYAGTDKEHLVKEAALLLMEAAQSTLLELERDAEFRAAVRRGIEQADRGELLSHEEVVARIKRLLPS